MRTVYQGQKQVLYKTISPMPVEQRAPRVSRRLQQCSSIVQITHARTKLVLLLACKRTTVS